MLRPHNTQDTGNSQVLKLLPDGSLVRVAGTGAPGSGPTGLNQPFGLALDTTTGTLYICDVTNQVGTAARVGSTAAWPQCSRCAVHTCSTVLRHL